MGELARGFHPGGISAPLPASAGGCRVGVTFVCSEEHLPDRRRLVAKSPSSQRPGFCSPSTEVVSSQGGIDSCPPKDAFLSTGCWFSYFHRSGPICSSGAVRFLKQASDAVPAWRSVSIRPRRGGWRGFRPWRPFPVPFPEGLFPGAVSPCRYL